MGDLQKEFTSAAPVQVLDETGKPANPGWARHPVFTLDRQLSWAPKRRFSSLDRYILFSPTHSFSFEIFDGGLLGYTRSLIISGRDKRQFQNMVTVPLPRGLFDMSSSSVDVDSTIKSRLQKNVFDFIVLKKGVRILRFDIPQFGHHRSLRGELVLRKREGAQSLYTNMQWPGQKNSFLFSRVSPCFEVEGVMQFESGNIVFTSGNGFGIFLWYRSVRPVSDVHLWACATAMNNGRLLGFTIGYGSADSSFGTENAFFVDGKIHKLQQVTFQINPNDYSLPWLFSSNDKRLEMTFTPSHEFSHQNALFFHSYKTNEVFGTFSGAVILDDGKALEFKNLFGLAERRKTNH